MPLLLHQRHQFVVEDGVLLVDQPVRLGGDGLQVALRRAHLAGTRGLQEVGKAHLEELVHVGRDDAHVAQPLQQRHVRAAGLREHAAVEREHGALAVEQGRQRRLVRRRHATGLFLQRRSPIVHPGSL